MGIIRDVLEELQIDYIVVELGDIGLNNLGLTPLEEGQWRDSKKKGWSQRLEPANPQMHGQRHVHIARTRYLNNKNQQVAWNINGSRHDKKTFNPNLSGIETAKRIARDALGLDDNVTLEHLSRASELLLAESVEVITSSPFEPICLSLKF